MKQTQNALKFLLAQYRAIFKHAYVKGLASAVLLTAGLAAGQAQAANVDPYYTATSFGDINTDGSEPQEKTTYSGSITNSGAAGAWANNTTGSSGQFAGTVSSGSLTLGAEQVSGAQIGTVSGGSAYGGYVITTNINASALGNELHVLSGGLVSGGNAVGGWAKATGAGLTAYASGNKVEIKDGGAVSGGQVIGAWASSLAGATATGNSISFSGSGGDSINTQQTIYGSMFGAIVANDINSTTGDYTAQGNTATINNATWTSSSSIKSLQLMGGYVTAGFIASGSAVSGNATQFNASANTLTLDNVTLSGGSTVDSGAMVAANYATAKPGSSGSTTIGEVIANGTSGTGLTISNSKFSYTSFFGGAAINKGAAQASSNVVTITDTATDHSSIFGAQVKTLEETSGELSFTANSNTVTINAASDEKKPFSHINTQVYGAYLDISKADSGTITTTVTTGNIVTIGAGNTFGLDASNSGSNIVGAYVVTNESGGATVTASNNSVTFNGTMTGDGQNKYGIIAGAQVMDHGVTTMQNNSVTINGKVTEGVIAAAYSTSDYKNGDNQPAVVNPVFTGNSVTIGADAEITGTDLYAFYAGQNISDTKIAATNNDVTVNGSVKNGNIYGGVGADSTITLANGSEYILQTTDGVTANNEYKIESDVISLAGKMQVGTGTQLTIRGFAKNGRLGVDTANTNTTTIADSAAIYNAGTIILRGETDVADGATLVATAANASLTVNGADIAKTLTKDDADYTLTGGTAALIISEANLQNYLQGGKDITLNNIPTKTASGSVNITSGGALEFKDDVVVVSDYDFITGTTPQPGKILVDDSSGSGKGSIIRGNELTLEHKLASNASTATDYKNLNPTTSAGILLEANVLNLGSSTLSSTQSQELQFGKATVKDEINFFAMTSGKDVSGDGSQLTFDNDGYHLTSEVIGSTYMETNDQNSNLEYYTALTGNINGDVTIEANSSDSGSLTIQNGNWTAHDTITVASGGALIVGDNDGITKPENYDGNSSPDATLLTNGVVLDVSTSDGEANIKAVGDDGSVYDADSYEDLLGDYRYVALDLRPGLTMRGDGNNYSTINGKATVTASSGAVILLNADDVNDILKQNNANGVAADSGAVFAADNGGLLYVEGDIDAKFTDFGDGTTHGFDLSGSTSPWSAGILAANSLTVTHANETTGEHDDANYIGGASNTVAFGGTVAVNDLEISDLQQTSGENKPDASNPYASQVVLKNGTAVISESLSSYNHTLVLGTTTAGDNAALIFESALRNDTGAIAVDQIDVVNGYVAVDNGVWTGTDTTINLSGEGTSLSVGGDGSDDQDEDFVASLTADGLIMGAGTSFDVNANGTATFNTADLTDLDTTAGGISVAGVLTIKGATITNDTNNGVHFGDAASITIENNGELHFGSLATNGAILASGKAYTGTTLTLNEGYSQIENLGGTLYLGFEQGTSFDKDAILALKDALFTDNSFTSDKMLINGGLLNIGNATFAGLNINTEYVGSDTVYRDGWTVNWDDIKQYADIYSEINDVTNTQKNQTNIHNIDLTDPITGSWGSLSLRDGVHEGAQVTIAGNTWLHYAAGNNCKFVSNDNSTAAMGAKVESHKDLYLIGGGEIGEVTLVQGSDDAEKNLTTLQVAGPGTTTIASINTADAVDTPVNARGTQINILGDTIVTGDIHDADYVSVSDGATLQINGDASLYNLEVVNATANFAQNLTVDAIDNGGDNDGELLAIGGTIKANDIDLVNDAGINAIDGGTITANTITVNSTNSIESVIQVGYDLDYLNVSLPEGTDTGTGYLEIADYLELNGATLVVDPAYGEATSVAAIMNFKDGRDTNYQNVVNNVGILNGSALVGKNAVLGVGATLEETKAAIAAYQNNGSLSASDYGSILYLNGQLTIAANSELALNADANVKTNEGIRNSLKYTITSSVLDQYADLGLGANTAILMTENAFEDVNGDKTGTAITFASKGAVVNANGGEIVLVGTFDASNPLNFFNDADNNGVEILQANGSDGTIKVYTQNGFLFATLNNANKGLGVQLHVDENAAYSVMSEASDPVVESLIAYHEGRIAPTSAGSTGSTGDSGATDSTGNTEETRATTTTTTSDTQVLAGTTTNDNGGNTDSGTDAGNGTGTDTGAGNNTNTNNTVAHTRVAGSSDFLNEVVTNSHGAPAEAAARLAIYGGTAQAALGASSSTTDAIAARLGVGSAGGLTIANNGQGAALWLAPVYKSHDSDGFDSQGLDYGVDLNLYGVALGADLELMPGFTAGLMFNVGSGDVDGKGNTAANNTSNDFDYWGAALYGSYRYDALTVAADIGYTVVDNDLEATTGMDKYGKLESSADSTALTFGVTAKYAFDFNTVEVAPHAGLRYTNVDLDDYTVTANGEDVAHFDAGSISVFSIPVGVTVAKEFVGDNWSVKPMFDLTLTGNFGDDEVDGTVSWTGVDNLTTGVSSEFLDNFTYGATLGVEAKTGSFSFGLGVNYTGASNADEYGVNANARFVF